MAAVEITKRTYAPRGLVGKFYMAPFSASGLLEPIGNVLEASTEQTEEVEKQPDMTALGGGTHAEDQPASVRQSDRCDRRSGER